MLPVLVGACVRNPTGTAHAYLANQGVFMPSLYLTNQGIEGAAAMPRNVIDAVQGTLDFLILQTLSWGEMHGYAIARWILDRSRSELQIEEGTLYPALHRLEEKGLLAAEWGQTETGRRAKFYRLTREGREELQVRAANWQRLTRAVNRVVRAVPESA
jgi:PadR family transcriptional regulator PadR